MAQSKAYDANAGQWPAFSGFKPLKPDSAEIRVLRLDNSCSKDRLCYLMHHKDIHASKNGAFSALSYSWGAPVPMPSQKEIIINGESVHIRPTLYSFLKTLATYDATVELWIDAVCINQSDIKERNQQISMMADIFSSAKQVFVWLGHGDDDTNYALEHVVRESPATSFDVQQFQPCVEKLFTASYWTRRWVLQEFALARQVIIVCGPHVAAWSKILEKINSKTLSGNQLALQTFENFEQIKALASQRSSTLLELMRRYESSRCIDRRDKAFALRGIASDGARLQPDYAETVTDVYFRILSQLPTEKVLPAMIGYRWPHIAAGHIQQSLLMLKNELFNSLQDKSSDVLLTAFEYIGTVSIATSGNIALVEGYVWELFGSKHIQPGDLVYSLQSSRTTPKGLLLAFRPGSGVRGAVGIISDFVPSAEARPLMEWRERVVTYGIEKCSRNYAAVTQKTRILCHISRLAMVWLALLDRRKDQQLYGYHSTGQLSREHRLCQCGFGSSSHQTSMDRVQINPGEPLEILPSLVYDSEHSWSASQSRLWVDPEATEHSFVTELKKQGSVQPDYEDHGRTYLSYAVEEGQIAWTRQILSQGGPDIEKADEDDRTQLIWAIIGQQEQTTKLLLESGRLNPYRMDRRGLNPLRWAIDTGYARGVELLLHEGGVDPNVIGQPRVSGLGERRPLSWAAQTKDLDVVRALLASDKINPNAQDADGITPLLWAARVNHTGIVEELLATRKVDCNVRDTSGRTPLSWAAQHGNVKVTELLLAQEDIEPDLMSGERLTPLRIAAQNGHLEVFKRIIDTGKVKYRFQYKAYDRLYGGQ